MSNVDGSAFLTGTATAFAWCVTKVMVLDDDEALLELYRDVLIDAGYDVTLAKDGAAGLELLSERPDAFIVDLMMPRIDGCEFIRRIRDTEDFKSKPALVVSAAGTKAWSQAACGADAFLAKPFAFETLLAQLKELTAPEGRQY